MMKLILIGTLLISSLFAEYVAEFGRIDGDIYVLRHGKLLKAFHGFKIDKYDTIHSKNFSKSVIIFNNDYRYKINGKKIVNIEKTMDLNPNLEIKTMKQIQNDKSKKSNMQEYKYNSKFYMQRAKVQKRKMEKELNRVYIDKKKDIYIESHTKDIVNISNNKNSHVEIGTVNIDPKSDVKQINIQGSSKNISNFTQGKNNRGSVDIGKINVK